MHLKMLTTIEVAWYLHSGPRRGEEGGCGPASVAIGLCNGASTRSSRVLRAERSLKLRGNYTVARATADALTERMKEAEQLEV
jgi:hypothetical protein